jgi:hypothetical protein
LKTQHKFSGGKLSLCIMTTNEQKTLESLGQNSYYGIGKDNVTTLQQSENLPVLDEKFRLVTKDYYTVMTQAVQDTQAFFFSSKVVKGWTKKGIQYVAFLDTTFDSADTSTMKAYRLDDTRASTTLKFVKTTPPPVELISEPVVEKRGISVPAADKAIDFENVPSMSAPAEKEDLEKKAADECSCVIL